jgi:hypothetical protein
LRAPDTLGNASDLGGGETGLGGGPAAAAAPPAKASSARRAPAPTITCKKAGLRKAQPAVPTLPNRARALSTATTKTNPASARAAATRPAVRAVQERAAAAVRFNRG